MTPSSASVLVTVLCLHTCLSSLATEHGVGNTGDPSVRINPVHAPFGQITSSPPLGVFSESLPLYTTDIGTHYMVDVQLGGRSNTTAPQNASLVVDTGSGDFVIFGEMHCEHREGINHVVRDYPCFQYQSSSTFQFNTDPTPGRKVNGNCEFNLPNHQGTFCREALLIDGYKAELFCELGWEDVNFLGMNLDPSNKPSAIRTDVCVVNDTQTQNYKMRYWNNTQGTIGMFYQICQNGNSKVECETPYPPILSSVPENLRHVFSLDLNPATEKSWMHFGEPAGGWAGKMEWSETQPVGLSGRSTSFSFPYAFHTFELYHMSVCGADLLSNYSSHWTAMVDTGAACLSLPQEFFDMVLAWVPSLDCVKEHVPGYDFSECTDSQCNGFKPITVCYLAEHAQPSDLPTITFRMSEDGAPLFLPLSGLMVNDRPSGRWRVCINPTDSISSYQGDQVKYLLYFPKISFGTLALRNLFTAFDMQAMAVGMRNKVEYDGLSITTLCAETKVCVGAQKWYQAKNTCLEPPCESLYFHEVNPQTHQCRMQPSFIACAVFTLLTFAFAEIALSEIYEKLCHKLSVQYLPST